MRKTILALGATIGILVAEPLTVAAVITITTFHVVFSIAGGNLPGSSDTKVYTVYRYDFNRHSRESIGRILERRRWERGSNYRDLLKLVQTIYAASSPKSFVFLSPE